MDAFPVGATATLDELADDPHPLLARLRAAEPVSWLPVLHGWLVTSYDAAVEVLRDPVAFTVDDPRFSTARLVGPSMLSLDGAEHARHRAPFAAVFHPARVRRRFAGPIAAEADRLISAMRPAGHAELRREFAGPLAAAVVVGALGLSDVGTDATLSWYRAIVSAVSAATVGEPISAAGIDAFDRLRTAVTGALDGDHSSGRGSLLARIAADPRGLTRDEVVSNAAVVMFGGIDTTEGMILNAARQLLIGSAPLTAVTGDVRLRNAVEECVRLEPAVALVDRYATADVRVGGAQIRRGDRVSVSIAGANRDPAVFADPESFDIGRTNARLNLAFAQGPHYCPAAQLARLETFIAIRRLADRLPGLGIDSRHPNTPRGLVFRKPPTLHVRWRAPG